METTSVCASVFGFVSACAGSFDGISRQLPKCRWTQGRLSETGRLSKDPRTVSRFAWLQQAQRNMVGKQAGIAGRPPNRSDSVGLVGLVDLCGQWTKVPPSSSFIEVTAKGDRKDSHCLQCDLLKLTPSETGER